MSHLTFVYKNTWFFKLQLWTIEVNTEPIDILQHFQTLWVKSL